MIKSGGKINKLFKQFCAQLIFTGQFSYQPIFTRLGHFLKFKTKKFKIIKLKTFAYADISPRNCNVNLHIYSGNEH